MKRKLVLFALTSACSGTFALSALTPLPQMANAASVSMDRTQYERTLSEAQTHYEMSKKNCSYVYGNPRDICIAKAKLQRTQTEVRAKIAFENTDEAREEGMIDIATAEYALAKEKCEALEGKAQDRCVEDAKTVYEKAKEEASASLGRDQPLPIMGEENMDAHYLIARTKCDSLSGDTKHICLTESK